MRREQQANDAQPRLGAQRREHVRVASVLPAPVLCPYQYFQKYRNITEASRPIAATNQDLEEMVQQRAFRADLFYR